MTIQDLKHFLIGLRSTDVYLWTENGELHYRAPPGRLTQHSMERIRANKEALIELLRDPTLAATPEADIPDRVTDTPTCIQAHMLGYYRHLKHPEFLHPSNVSLWEGELDADILQKSLNHLVARHDALRCRIAVGRGDQPRLYADAAMKVSILRQDLSTMSDERAQELAARHRVTELLTRTFDVYRGPLLRVGVLQLRSAANVVMVVFHHVVFDASSSEVFFNDLMRVYSCIRSGRPPDLPPVKTGFLDVVREKARWSAAGDATEHTRFWQQRFQNAERPFWLPRDAHASEGDSALESEDPGPVQGRLAPSAAARLATVCRAESITFQSLLTAAFALAIGRWTGKDEVCLWVFNHGRQKVEHFEVIGCLIDTWPLQIRLGGASITRGLLRRVETTYSEARPHIHVPSQHVAQIIAAAQGGELERATLLSYARTSDSAALPMAAAQGFQTRPLDWTRTRGHLESINGTQLGIHVLEGAESVDWSMQYDPTVFQRSSIASLSESVCSILQTAAGDL